MKSPFPAAAVATVAARRRSSPSSAPPPREAARQARAFSPRGLEMVEITFTVPGAADLVRELLAERGRPTARLDRHGNGHHAGRAPARRSRPAPNSWSPRTSAPRSPRRPRADVFLCMGALTPTELVAAHELGADLVKVYPLPPVGGAAYLSVVRQPLGDIPMLAGGGFGIEEIPAYRAAGAVAFGIGGAAARRRRPRPGRGGDRRARCALARGEASRMSQRDAGAARPDLRPHAGDLRHRHRRRLRSSRCGRAAAPSSRPAPSTRCASCSRSGTRRARRSIDLDRAYVELRGSFDPDEDHWTQLAEIEPVVPPTPAARASTAGSCCR